MESSRLQSLVNEILEPLQGDPQILLKRILGENNFIKLNALMYSGIIRNFLPPQFNPVSFVATLLDKLGNLAPEFWQEFETILLGVLQGDEEATAKAKKFFGVVMDADKN